LDLERQFSPKETLVCAARDSYFGQQETLGRDKKTPPGIGASAQESFFSVHPVSDLKRLRKET